MNADGKLLSLADDRDEYYLQDPRQPTVASLPEDAAALMQSFLQQEAPDLLPLCREFVPGMEYDFGGTLYEFVTAFDENGGETDISFVVQLGTSPKIITASLISF